MERCSEITLLLRKKMSVYAVGIVALLAVLLVPDDAHAQEKVRWELIFLSADHGCANYQYQMANVYDELASKYFELYKFPNSKYNPQCMSDKKYANYTAPDDLDLLILVYDKQIGKKELHPNDVGGLYSHLGSDRAKNHVIVLCDCPTFGFSYPMFTLSHELSHFVTYYLGFDLLAQNEIHEISAKYNQCNDSSWDDTCAQVVTHVYGDHYFTRAPVMVPYQPAVGGHLVDHTNLQSDIASSDVVMNIQKQITKWWLAGKINDTEYTKELEFVMGKPSAQPEGAPDNVLLAAGHNGKEEVDTYYDLGEEENKKTQILLKRVPFKADNHTEYGEQIPMWFKLRAHSWLQDNSLSNRDFVDGVRYLFGGSGK
ncbi:MAG: hypothetical protein EPO62_01805 [Candidatus Nitrosotenuis sp.]|nr:MAG: hypothetical protein EPO62_01805 [Candidatus Nitrosotenuis sp.]